MTITGHRVDPWVPRLVGRVVTDTWGGPLDSRSTGPRVTTVTTVSVHGRPLDSRIGWSGGGGDDPRNAGRTLSGVILLPVLKVVG